MNRKHLPGRLVPAVSFILGSLLAAQAAHALPERLSVTRQDALARLEANAAGALDQRSRKAAAYGMVHAKGATPLMADNAHAAPAERALLFLSVYGAAFGVHSQAEQLGVQRVSRDDAGNSHVHLDQLHAGVPVFGARLVVHMNGAGITGANGVFLPDLASVSTTPARDIAALRAAALVAAGKKHPGRSLDIKSARWVIYPLGLLRGRYVGSRLAYEAIVTAPQGDVRERLFIDGRKGVVLDGISEIHSVLNREIYTPEQQTPTDPPVPVQPTLDEQASTLTVPEGPADPALINDPGHNGTDVSDDVTGNPPTDNLWIFAGGTYALYDNMFGRKGYDACDDGGNCQPDTAAPAWSITRAEPFSGQLQKSVYLVNANCPNAYWNGDSTNYCPGFDADDVVSHEWSHAYTQYTHDLIYAYQSGALNESYSDIFGETYDLVNKLEGPLGSLTLDEHKYWEEGGSRWVMGEDLSEEASILLLRDMWKPDDFGGEGAGTTPGKATSANYTCGSSDGGGVHTNSSVPNHAFAMLVDGTNGQGPMASTGDERNSYNHQKFPGIGLVKAAHIYFQAMAHHQTPTTDFPQHADALRTSCEELKGQNLKGPTGALSGQIIGEADCDVVDKAIAATEMDLGTVCPFTPVLQQPAPAICPGATTIWSENWESGDDGWTKTSTGQYAEWEDASRNLRDFVLDSTLPASRPGTAAFARNIPVGEPGGGTCQPGGDYSGLFTYDGPEFTIPAGATDLHVRFDHYVATEATADGGQLEINVNDGGFVVVEQDAYDFNPPNSALLGILDTSNNPRGGQYAWNGTDINPPSGSPPSTWGTTVVNLAGLVAPGDTVRLRLTFAQEGCNGVDGWYVDTIQAYSCPILDPPTIAVGSDYENPDTNGTFTLNWTRPAGASGPDQLQTSTTSCAPAFSDDAEDPLVGGENALWAGSTQWTSSANPGDASTAYYIPDASSQDDALTLIAPVTVPAIGATALTFSTRYGLESGYDFGHVEISGDGGTTWATLTTLNGPAGLGATPADVIEETQSLDVSAYAGQPVLLRFRVTSDSYNEGLPAGWYVDNIALINDNWGDVLSTAAVTHTLTKQPVGTHCYRVRTQYTIGGGLVASPYSDLATVVVNATTGGGGGGGGGIPAVTPPPQTVGNNQLGGALPLASLVLLSLAGFLRRRR
jgi:bacillolysin